MHTHTLTNQDGGVEVRRTTSSCYYCPPTMGSDVEDFKLRTERHGDDFAAQWAVERFGNSYGRAIIEEGRS